jgi:uncharacterized protein
MRRPSLRKFIPCGLAALGLLIPSVGLALAAEVPPLKGRVNDYAKMLSPSTERRLEGVLRDLEQTDSTQIVVLTIPSLGGDSLEDFSIRVAEAWQIGRKDVDNGALLLIARNDRKVRIEVGYGLEGSLTDLMSGRIIRNVIVPQFKQGHFDQGILEGVYAMIAAVRGEYSALAKPARQRPGDINMHKIIFGLFIFILIVNVLGRLRKPFGAVAGGILAPIMGASFLGLGLLGILLLIPMGLVGGLILSLIGPGLSFGRRSVSGRHFGGWYAGSGPRFSSGSFGGFGGFSGGGGGFGGGGASGGW